MRTVPFNMVALYKESTILKQPHQGDIIWNSHESSYDFVIFPNVLSYEATL